MYFFSRIPPQSEGREALCLPNLLAGGLPAGALPGLALACAADKRAQHTRATQKSTTRARHTKRDAWIYTGDITAAIAPPPHLYRFFHIFSRVYPCISFCVARVCCALLCGARVLCSFCQLHMQAPDRAAHLQASSQPRD